VRTTYLILKTSISMMFDHACITYEVNGWSIINYSIIKKKPPCLAAKESKQAKKVAAGWL
jgi:hypothetical protein